MFNEIIEYISKASANEALEILFRFTDILRREREGKGSIKAIHGLIELSGDKGLIVLGDIHGDLNTLQKILLREDVEKAVKANQVYLVFLGDYVDRGLYSAEVYLTIAYLKAEYPDRIVTLRGNHEPPPNLTPYPHDLPYRLRAKYGEEWNTIYQHMFTTFQLLPHAAIYRGEIFLVHGGIPVNVSELTLHDIAYADIYYPKKTILEELLWSDPDEYVDEWTYSPRGAGYLFGRNVTKRFLSKFNLKLIIRGHEPCEGYKFNHENKVLTLFSRKGSPYYNYNAAYLFLAKGKSTTFSNIKNSIRLI
ncbi:MAG TPA: serine/threonine protein phosphatase [Desulfurococcales archaeon]|nr:serine/threonine protein phosphatase [Desulfurococcales archaeon]